MDDRDSGDGQLADRANALYWDSDGSVNDIAEALDLSKGSLYNLIQPAATAIACPECDTAMEYPNRTARDKGYVTCPGCGLEEEEEVIRGLAGEGLPSLIEPRTVPVGGQRTLWATILLGAAAGIVLARWMRR
jgi:UDP-N-acetylmuramyl tripeptide synthase